MREMDMSTGKPRRYIVGNARVAAGSIMAAATLAAVTAFASAPPVAPQPTTTGAAAPPSRLQGVHADLKRAVALRQVTAEQADRFEAQLVRRIQAGA